MLRSIKSLIGTPIQSLDGRIGSVSDLYFDDRRWRIRYLVVDTGRLLLGRRVLISPDAVGALPRGARVFPILLTRKQIVESPEIYTDLPVSRQREQSLARHFGWPDVWGDQATAASIGYRLTLETPPETEVEADGADPHLRSSNEVIGYHIRSLDGEAGCIDDLIFGDDIWAIRFLVVNAGNGLPGNKVLVASSRVDQISWNEKLVRIGVLREVLERCPPYDPQRPFNLQD